MKKQPDLKVLKQGFTLLELSIVLVIISLLVGGIVGIRTYVKNAELITLMNESKFYISAFNQFQTRYGAPPGDYNLANTTWPGTGVGDGNGVIRANGGAGNTVEWWLAFQHLALGGYIPGTYTGAANGLGGATAGVNVPASSVLPYAFMFDHPNAMDGLLSGDAVYPDGTYGNYLLVAGAGAPSAGAINGTELGSKQMAMLDTKFDDGIPTSGNIVVPKTLTGCYGGSTYTIGAEKVCYFFEKFQ